MLHGFRWYNQVLGLASAVLLVSALGCGNPTPAGKPSNGAPPSHPKDGNKESKPPNPDPG